MQPTRSIRLWALLAVWLLLARDTAFPQAAKDTIPQAKLIGESQRTASRLASAQRKIEQRQWPEAIEELQAVLEEAGDDLVPLDPEQTRHWVAARRLCHARLAVLPPAALKQYRARVDTPAKKLLDKAEPTRDVTLLKRIVEDYFASRAAERALDLLGDLAFERGDFHEAERWWRHLTRPLAASQRVGQLAYPDPQLDPALVRAKLILAAMFRGDPALAQEQLKTFRALHPKSEGELAGSKGNYADILQKLIEQKDLSPPPSDDTAWPTFAGDASRSHTLPRMPRVRWLEEPWRVRLDGKPVDAKAEEPPPVNYRNASAAARALAYYPVIVGNRVIVADARFVAVHDLNTGRRLFRYDLLANAGPRIEPEVPVKHDERFTLTVAEGRIFVRLGLPVFGFPKEGEAAQASQLVCLEMPVGDQGELTRRWQVTPRAEGKDLACFEGSPVVQSGWVWIAQTRFNRNVAATAIECYDASTGTRRWRQEVCEATELTPGGEPRYRAHLLTLAGPNVVYCSHAGAIVAVDAVTGKRSWSLRYPRRGSKPTDGQLSPRDLAPAVYAEGRVYVAPGDLDRILCLDVLTGRTLWESKPTEVVHLLGVARGKLIFTTGNQPRGIRALDAATGDDLRGWLQPDDGQGELPSLGRAVFAGDWLLWPTVREGLRILNLEDGRVADKHFLPPGTVRSGNLAVANGCAVVATDRELLGYVAPARLLEPRKKAAAAEPQSPEARFRLATAKASAGMIENAAKDFDQVGELAVNSRKWALGPLRDQAWRHRDELFWENAEMQRDQGNPDAALAYLKLRDAISVTMQVRGFTEIARLCEQADSPQSAVANWQAIVGHRQWGNSLIDDEEGVPQRAAVHAAGRIESLLRNGSPKLLAQIEKECREEVNASKAHNKDDSDDQLLAELSDRYPGLRSVGKALARLAIECETKKEFHLAAAANRRRLRFSSQPMDQIMGLAGLARAYEGMGCWEAAKTTWRRLADDYGPLDFPDKKVAVREHVARQLSKPEYAVEHLNGLPEFRQALQPVWKQDDPVHWLGGSLWPVGIGHSKATAFFWKSAEKFTCHEAVSGKKLWSRETDSASWLGCHGDLVVAGQPQAIFYLRQRTGEFCGAMALWEPDEGVFSHFQIAAGRLYFLQGERRLYCVDVETGKVLWHHWAPGAAVRPLEPGGKFNPLYHAGKDRLLLQTSLGRIWLLDSATGRKVADIDSKHGVWLQPPLPLDEQRVVIAPGRRHLTMLDFISGKVLWTYEVDRKFTLSGEAPQVLGSGEHLVCCMPRNYGYELERLDVRTGARLWPQPVLLRERPNLRCAALDESSVYITAGGVLQAVALANGLRLWQQPLTGGAGNWRALLTKNYLLAHPAEAETSVNAAFLARRYLPLDGAALFPTVAPWSVARIVPECMWAFSRSQAPSKLPLVLLDPKTGKVLHRLNFDGRGPAAGVALFDKQAIVTIGDRAWGLR